MSDDQQFLVYTPPIKAGPRHKILHYPHVAKKPISGPLAMCERTGLRRCHFRLEDGHRLCIPCVNAMAKWEAEHGPLLAS